MSSSSSPTSQEECSGSTRYWRRRGTSLSWSQDEGGRSQDQVAGSSDCRKRSGQEGSGGRRDRGLQEGPRRLESGCRKGREGSRGGCQRGQESRREGQERRRREAQDAGGRAYRRQASGGQGRAGPKGSRSQAQDVRNETGPEDACSREAGAEVGYRLASPTIAGFLMITK